MLPHREVKSPKREKVICTVNFEKCIQDFLDYIELERNCSPQTVKGYRAELNFMFRYFKGHGLPLEVQRITLQHVRQYLAYAKKDRNNSPASLNKKISVLRSFFHFLAGDEGYGIEKNPVSRLTQVKKEKKLPQILSLEESRKFLLGIKEVSPYPERDFAIFILFLHTGCRLRELKELTVSSIDLQERLVLFMGKGSRERVVPLLEETCRALEEYLKVRKPLVETNQLFLNSRGMPISSETIARTFKTLAQKTGVYRKGLSVHKLRHTCLTLLLKEGIDVRTLQEIAGHADIATTQIYTHVAQVDLKRQMNKHPLAKKVEGKLT